PPSSSPPPVPIHIICPFCSIPFTKTPLLLSCGHSLCDECVGDFRWKINGAWGSVFKDHQKCPICTLPVKSIVNN
ncbi:hypothetical protein PMAYCL1PPCAC_23048, partial [Pristionchus mayeri]